MENLQTGAGPLIAAVGAAFLALVAAKAAAGLRVVVTALGRGLYWVTLGWWINRIMAVLVGV
jgi:hypothetical protein